MDYMNYTQPKLSIVKTVGNYFRVEIHGKDSLQNNKQYAIMDIGRGATKDEALAQAKKWFESIEDRTPKEDENESGVEDGMPEVCADCREEFKITAEHCDGCPDNPASA